MSISIHGTRLVSMKEMISQARAEGYAVGQFNIYGLQWIQAALQAAEEERSPVIIASSDRIVEFLGGFRLIAAMTEEMIRQMNITVPVALHLDHGKNAERCRQAIDAGYSSVMIDGSHDPIAENIAMTKEVIAYAHARGVSVEAEVGTIGGTEDELRGEVRYADPDECLRLVSETGIDALAAALGSVHGLYQGEPKLGFEQMRRIAELTQVPLVLHGGSGIPDYQIARAIELGHAKINVNTECLQAWSGALRNKLTADEHLFDPRPILNAGRDAIAATIKEKMLLFKSSRRV